MLKILLVDDETIIRKGLARIIEDFDAGFEVVGEAADGEEALELVERCRPHVAIVDMMMPKVNGLQFIERLNQIDPHVHKIILSGHAEFTYARKAICGGVLDYILKPIDEDQLRSALDNALCAVEKADAAARVEREQQLLIKESLAHLTEQLSRDITRTGLYAQPGQARAQLALLGLPGELGCFRIAAIHIDTGLQLHRNRREHHYEQNSFRKMMGSAMAELPLFLPHLDRSGVVALLGADDSRPTDRALEALYGDLRHQQKVAVTLVVSEPFEHLSQAGQNMDRVAQSLANAFYRTGVTRIDVTPESVRAHSEAELTLSLPAQKALDRAQESILAHINRNDALGLRRAWESFGLALRHCGAPGTLARRIFSDAFSRILQEYQRLASTLTRLHGEEYSYIQQIELLETCEAILDYTTTVCVEMMSGMHRSAGKGNRLVDMIKTYVDDNYSEQITLGRISEIAHVSPNYICELFHEQTGEHFLDYLTRIRIERAKALLRDKGMKAYQVGTLVGYDDPTYFSKVFKKLVGVPPNAYRNLAI